MEATKWELLAAAAQAEQEANLNAGWVDTVFKVGERALHDRLSVPKRLNLRPAAQDAVEPDGQRRPPHVLLRAGGDGACARAGVTVG